MNACLFPGEFYDSAPPSSCCWLIHFWIVGYFSFSLFYSKTSWCFPSNWKICEWYFSCLCCCLFLQWLCSFWTFCEVLAAVKGLVVAATCGDDSLATDFADDAVDDELLLLPSQLIVSRLQHTHHSCDKSHQEFLKVHLKKLSGKDLMPPYCSFWEARHPFY